MLQWAEQHISLAKARARQEAHERVTFSNPSMWTSLRWLYRCRQCASSVLVHTVRCRAYFFSTCGVVEKRVITFWSATLRTDMRIASALKLFMSIVFCSSTSEYPNIMIHVWSCHQALLSILSHCLVFPLDFPNSRQADHWQLLTSSSQFSWMSATSQLQIHRQQKWKWKLKRIRATIHERYVSTIPTIIDCTSGREN